MRVSSAGSVGYLGGVETRRWFEPVGRGEGEEEGEEEK